MRCAACGVENPPGSKFCLGCGAALARRCPHCGTAASLACRGSATSAAQRLWQGRRRSLESPKSKLRPWWSWRAPPPSVGCARCCSSTSSGSRRSPRNGTPRRSEICSPSTSIVPRPSSATTAGTVEKFIGDAVMAVWGAPVANEDDAERAVRAALEVVASVTELGVESGVELAARAGIVTGEVAITIGKVAEGMVLGDTVNSASRVQSVAPPGAVLVDESTWRAASGAIAFTEVGDAPSEGQGGGRPGLAGASSRRPAQGRRTIRAPGTPVRRS